MNVLIIGNGPEEHSWALWFAERAEYPLVAIWPGPAPESLDWVPVARDLDDALAVPGIDLVIVGGPREVRGEALRRAAAEGFAIICIHPPGEDSEAYYQVSLSRSETGAVVVPDLPLRLHPGVTRLREAIDRGEFGEFRGIRHELAAGLEEDDLVRGTFARAVDVTRAILGEIETVTASGEPRGERPDVELVVQLRAAGGRRAEFRASAESAEPCRLTFTGTAGSMTLEYDRDLTTPARLIRRTGTGSASDQIATLEAWDPREAILRVLRDSLATTGEGATSGPVASGPSLADGTRAMELSEAVARSLRKGRTIDLHYELISEESTFKSVMTSTGCMLLLGALLLLPVALAGPALGMPWTIYLAYAILPVLVLFAMSQILRIGLNRETNRRAPRAPGPGSHRLKGSDPAADQSTD